MADNRQSGRPMQIGEYRILKRLGAGSFAQVFEADNPKTGERLAIKAIQLSRLSPKLVKGLEAEITILKQVNHPNIIKLADVKRSSRWVYLVMEFAMGGDLQGLLRARGRLTEPEARYLFCQLAAGLDTLLRRRLVHRDIKPQNLLLDRAWPKHARETCERLASSAPLPSPSTSSPSREGEMKLPRLKIGDFGFARHLGVADMAETLCGSPLYMAPELLRFQRYDARCDLWSAGAVLYQMLAGKPPFSGSNPMDLLRRIDSAPAPGAPPLPSGVAVSPAAMYLLNGLLQRDASERLSVAEVMGSEFVSGRPSLLRSVASDHGSGSAAPETATVAVAAADRDDDDEEAGFSSRKARPDTTTAAAAAAAAAAASASSAMTPVAAPQGRDDDQSGAPAGETVAEAPLGATNAVAKPGHAEDIDAAVRAPIVPDITPHEDTGVQAKPLHQGADSTTTDTEEAGQAASSDTRTASQHNSSPEHAPSEPKPVLPSRAQLDGASLGVFAGAPQQGPEPPHVTLTTLSLAPAASPTPPATVWVEPGHTLLLTTQLEHATSGEFFSQRLPHLETEPEPSLLHTASGGGASGFAPSTLLHCARAACLAAGTLWSHATSAPSPLLDPSSSPRLPVPSSVLQRAPPQPRPHQLASFQKATAQRAKQAAEGALNAFLTAASLAHAAAAASAVMSPDAAGAPKQVESGANDCLEAAEEGFKACTALCRAMDARSKRLAEDKRRGEAEEKPAAYGACTVGGGARLCSSMAAAALRRHESEKLLRGTGADTVTHQADVQRTGGLLALGALWAHQQGGSLGRLSPEEQERCEWMATALTSAVLS